MIVDNAIYVGGQRTAEPESLRETYQAAHEQRGVAWIGLYKPTEEEFASVAEEFGCTSWLSRTRWRRTKGPRSSATPRPCSSS